MGTGSRYYRAALGQALGESQAIQQHQLAMIPIVEQQAESELKIMAAQQEKEIKYIETLSDVLKKFPGSQPQQVIYSQPASATTEKSKMNKNNLLIFAALGIIAYFLLKKR